MQFKVKCGMGDGAFDVLSLPHRLDRYSVTIGNMQNQCMQMTAASDLFTITFINTAQRTTLR